MQGHVEHQIWFLGITTLEVIDFKHRYAIWWSNILLPSFLSTGQCSNHLLVMVSFIDIINNKIQTGICMVGHIESQISSTLEIKFDHCYAIWWKYHMKSPRMNISSLSESIGHRSNHPVLSSSRTKYRNRKQGSDVSVLFSLATVNRDFYLLFYYHLQSPKFSFCCI